MLAVASACSPKCIGPRRPCRLGRADPVPGPQTGGSVAWTGAGRRRRRRIMKIASFVFPHIGGTYTVFRHLRPALAERGVDLRWIGVGARQAARFRADEWREALGYGTMLVPAEENVRLQAAAVIHHLQAERYDAVFVNVLSDRV